MSTWARSQVKFKSRQDAKMLEGSLYSHIEQLWNQTQREIAAGDFKPMTDASLKECLRQLTWWKS